MVKIAVIGAGSSGMTATKQALDQGFDVTVIEKTNYTGGLWRFQENLDENGIASVMQSTIINTSKEMSAFSDFPPDENLPNFMHNSKMVAYFDAYAARFNFNKYVRFRTEVVSLQPADDYEETGRWKLISRNLDTKEEKTEVYDGVMICTGHHNTVNEPKFKGQEKFKGTVTHTHSLKNAKGFENKNVVVVGVGNSGGDAAVEISSVAKQVYLSTRTGTWLFHRVGHDGRPLDQLLNRRFLWRLMNYLPYSFICTIIEMYLNCGINHERYQLKPKHRVFSQHIFINDALPNKILSGQVIVKGDIEEFTENGVIFKGDNKVTECDAVILATGYKIVFPYLSQDILPVNRNKVRLYKHQFVHTLKHPHTLALIGLVQPIGNIFNIAEMQARWFSLLMGGKKRLPSKTEMEKTIREQDRYLSRYYDSERQTIQVDWQPFIDELAQQVGCYPNLTKYFFTDPKLWFACWFGANAAYQYRLEGPNQWAGARDAMVTVQKRINAPLETNKGRQQSENKLTNLTFFHLILIVLFLSIVISSVFSAIVTVILT